VKPYFKRVCNGFTTLGHKAGLDSLLNKRLDFSLNRGKLKKVCKADSKIKRGTGEDVSPLFPDAHPGRENKPPFLITTRHFPSSAKIVEG